MFFFFLLHSYVQSPQFLRAGPPGPQHHSRPGCLLVFRHQLFGQQSISIGINKPLAPPHTLEQLEPSGLSPWPPGAAPPPPRQLSPLGRLCSHTHGRGCWSITQEGTELPPASKPLGASLQSRARGGVRGGTWWGPGSHAGRPQVGNRLPPAG